MSLRILRELLSTKTKQSMVKRFGCLYPIYERRYILNTLSLKKYYVKEDDSLHIGKGVIPMRLVCDAKKMGFFNNEYPDVIAPFLPCANGGEDYNEGPYEFGNVRLEKGDVVFDCGANMGFFSILAANYDCQCYAFEPLPANIAHLNEIVRVNPHIVIAPYALCDEDKSLQFTDSASSSTTTRILFDEEEADTITVEGMSMDSYVEKSKIDRIDFIKADIEGAERYMLMGARNVLKEFAPKIAICTYHLPDDPQVLRQLILDANANYIIEERWKKMYAYVRK